MVEEWYFNTLLLKVGGGGQNATYLFFQPDPWGEENILYSWSFICINFFVYVFFVATVFFVLCSFTKPLWSNCWSCIERMNVFYFYCLCHFLPLIFKCFHFRFYNTCICILMHLGYFYCGSVTCSWKFKLMSNYLCKVWTLEHVCLSSGCFLLTVKSTVHFYFCCSYNYPSTCLTGYSCRHTSIFFDSIALQIPIWA